METPEQRVNFSKLKRHLNDINGLVLVSLLLTFNRFYISFGVSIFIFSIYSFFYFKTKCALKFSFKYNCNVKTETITNSHKNKHSWNPPPPTGGQDLSKIESLGGGGRGYEIFCWKRGINLKRGVDVEMGGCQFFYHIYCVCVCVGGGRSNVPFITFKIFSQPCKILIQVFIVLNPGIICTFLIHSGSLQKILTALFHIFWNTYKSKWTISF